jgi:hypothetical protein
VGQVLAAPDQFPNPSNLVPAVPSHPASGAASPVVGTGNISTTEAASASSGVIQSEAKAFSKASPGDIGEDSSDDIPMVNIEPDTDENSDEDDIILDG